jgi:hypothetical protein
MSELQASQFHLAISIWGDSRVCVMLICEIFLDLKAHFVNLPQSVLKSSKYAGVWQGVAG